MSDIDKHLEQVWREAIAAADATAAKKIVSPDLKDLSEMSAPPASKVAQAEAKRVSPAPGDFAGISTPPSSPATVISEPPASPSKRALQWGIPAAALGVLVISILLIRSCPARRSVSYTPTTTTVSPGQQIDPYQLINRQIDQGNLVGQNGNSAFDLYTQYSSQLSDTEKAALTGNVSASLRQQGERLLNDIKDNNDITRSNLQEGMRKYRWLNHLDPSDENEAKAAFLEGRVALLDENYSLAKDKFGRAAKSQNDWSLLLNSLGKVYFKLDDKEEAKTYYRKAINAEPDWIYPYLNLGALYNTLQEYSEAEAIAREAIKLDADKATAHWILGTAIEGQGDKCSAIRHYEKALELAAGMDSPGFDVASLERYLPTLKFGC